MYTYAMKVDIGVSEKQNDDRALLSDILLMGSCLSGKLKKESVIAAVCDGVGGLEQGYRAAMCCLERISHLSKADITKEEIHEAIEEANVRIRNMQSMEKLHRGMMTTVAGIYANAEFLPPSQSENNSVKDSPPDGLSPQNSQNRNHCWTDASESFPLSP